MAHVLRLLVSIRRTKQSSEIVDRVAPASRVGDRGILEWTPASSRHCWSSPHEDMAQYDRWALGDSGQELEA